MLGFTVLLSVEEKRLLFGVCFYEAMTTSNNFWERVIYPLFVMLVVGRCPLMEVSR